MSNSVLPLTPLPASRADLDLLAKQAVATVQQLGEELPTPIKDRIYQDVVRSLAIKAGLNPRDSVETD